MIETFSMGQHAAYVWSAYGITLVILALTAWAARRRKAGALERARRQVAEERPSRRPTVRQME